MAEGSGHAFFYYKKLDGLKQTGKTGIMLMHGVCPADRRKERGKTARVRWETGDESLKEGDGAVRISVRNLVEFVFRSGDLDNRRTSGAQKEAMQAGSRLHRKIQRQMGAGYQAEVSFKHTFYEEEIGIQVEGRADGILTEPEGVTVDEIKCVYMDLEELTEPVPVHLAQAMCYGYLYGLDHPLSSVAFQITYCSIETEEIRRFQTERSWEELEDWFSRLLHEYVKWARYLYHHELRRNQSIKDLEFPYPYREGQRELAAAVYKSISRGKNLFIQAPTGIGKTLSVVFPAVKAMGEGKADKLFYLTAKTITREAAQEALTVLRSHGLLFKSVTITAKEKLCFLEKLECNPEACPYAKGHFDRVNDGVYEILQKEQEMTREKILAYARRFQVCPFEFCLDISSWVDGIICDYNYVFDPNVRLKRYFSEGNPQGKYLFLADEAHNLVDRARNMYSAGLIKEDFLAVKKLVKKRSPRLAGLLDKCSKALLPIKRECETYQLLPDVNHFTVHLMSAFGELETFMDRNLEFEGRDKVLDFYFAVRDFLYTQGRLDERYEIYGELLPSGQFLLRLFCVDPSGELKECMNQAVSTVFFSATLLPVQYYKELLSGDLEEYAVYAHSPFPPQNRLLMIAKDVSSRYTRRNAREYEKMADYIEEVVKGRQGNYLVFCPSYQYLGEIEALLRRRWEDGPNYPKLAVQSLGMTETEKEDFLRQFGPPGEDGGRGLTALCVMGGVFSEGIDLAGDRLIGVIIIGTGLPMISTEQEILKQYFDRKGKNGFDYAYQYPGMNKVLQAAGRVIRTMEDKGVIALLDDRFLRADHQALFPREWDSYYAVDRSQVKQVIQTFWNGP